MRWCWHDWGVWGDLEEEALPIAGTGLVEKVIVQRRTCRRCNLVRSRRVDR